MRASAATKLTRTRKEKRGHSYRSSIEFTSQASMRSASIKSMGMTPIFPSVGDIIRLRHIPEDRWEVLYTSKNHLIIERQPPPGDAICWFSYEETTEIVKHE